MQVAADWRSSFTNVEDFEEDFGKFEGPGFYLTDTYTLLAVPFFVGTRGTKRFPRTDDTNVWVKNQPAGVRYELYCYNCKFADTIFAAIAVAPVRRDLREQKEAAP